MSDEFDEIMKSYFSDKQEPPLEIQEKLRDKLIEAEQGREIKICWAIMLFALILSAVIMLILRSFVGNNFIMIAGAIYFTLLLFSGAAIILACQFDKIKINRGSFKCYFL